MLVEGWRCSSSTSVRDLIEDRAYNSCAFLMCVGDRFEDHLTKMVLVAVESVAQARVDCISWSLSLMYFPRHFTPSQFVLTKVARRSDTAAVHNLRLILCRGDYSVQSYAAAIVGDRTDTRHVLRQYRSVPPDGAVIIAALSQISGTFWIRRTSGSLVIPVFSVDGYPMNDDPPQNPNLSAPSSKLHHELGAATRLWHSQFADGHGGRFGQLDCNLGHAVQIEPGLRPQSPKHGNFPSVGRRLSAILP